MNISHGPDLSEPADVIPAYRCHYQLIAGYLHYCNDCTHALCGQVVELPDLPIHLQGPIVP